MEIIQAPVSENHKSAMFFNGVVAYGKAENGKTYVLTTEGESEILYDGESWLSGQLRELATKFNIDDEMIEEEQEVDILVDGWLVIAEVNGRNFEDILYAEDQDEDRIFDNYDDAIEGFELFLSKS